MKMVSTNGTILYYFITLIDNDGSAALTDSFPLSSA